MRREGVGEEEMKNEFRNEKKGKSGLKNQYDHVKNEGGREDEDITQPVQQQQLKKANK